MQRSSRVIFAIITFSIGLSLAAGCGGSPSASPNTNNHKITANRHVQRNGKGNTARHAIKPPKPYSAPPAKLPSGNASAGARVYSTSCESCHARGGTGTGNGPRLAKPSNVMASFKTQAALAQFIAHNMPANNPGILKAKNAADVAAYVWRLAGGK